MLNIKRLSECIGKKVFTDAGDFFGMVDGINLVDNKIDGWRLLAGRESNVLHLLGGARGIVVPHQFIKAIGDVFLISRNAVPMGNASSEEEDELPLDDDDLM
ncbi:MAG: sporulation protein YlmC with PRC-barrel domain [Patescibacteria group bacterium]|jgi:sporulation protein YlmC with PRC-barrel domain